MKRLVDATCDEARSHFLKGSSYFNGDFPSYISFEPILSAVHQALGGQSYRAFQKAERPESLPNVNFELTTNKDGRFAWRPYELMHPAIYVSLVDTICDESHWEQITQRYAEFEGGSVECCSALLISLDHHSDKATQVRSWWRQVEQRSLTCSLDFSHLLHTDVTNCYGSIYTHSIPWALHGKEVAKENKGKKDLLGDKIDAHIRASRYGQTNGISQGSVLMDFVAELVLGYVDELISESLGQPDGFRVLRYRDDYRIFANSDETAEEILKTISDKLRTVGMALGASKTQMSRNVVEGSIKPDKLAGIDLQDLGKENAKTIQKQLLRLHSFGLRYPNSGALRRLLGELHMTLMKQTKAPEDLGVQVAIAADIALVSPLAFPAIAAILSHLIALAPNDGKLALWSSVKRKMSKVPHNGYLEIWLQRVMKPALGGIAFSSSERICRIVEGEEVDLWENAWISSADLIAALDTAKILVGEPTELAAVMAPSEIELFKQIAWAY